MMEPTDEEPLEFDMTDTLFGVGIKEGNQHMLLISKSSNKIIAVIEGAMFEGMIDFYMHQTYGSYLEKDVKLQ